MPEVAFFLIAFIQALALSLILTPFSIWLALRTNHLDHPGHRKIHFAPHPVLGGLAIFLAFNISILVDIALVKTSLVTNPDFFSPGFIRDLLDRLRVHTPGIGMVEHKLYSIMLGSLVIFLMGLWDDRHSLRPKWKLLVQTIAALIVVRSGISFDLFTGIPLLNKILTVIWIVGWSNSFNFLDNMDGLSAGVAAIVSFFFGVAAYQMGQTFMALIFFLFLGSVLGFLHFNRSPAKTFMGDAGSMFIGYMVACLSVVMTYYDVTSRTFLAVSKPLVILAVPAFDTLSVLFIRMKNRRPIFEGDKNHFSHRLVALGMTHKRAVLFIYLVTFCTGLGAVLMRGQNLFGALVILSQVGIVFWIIVLLERVKTPDDKG